MTSFSDKLAVITGAGDGMGRALARQLAAAGADLAICDLFPDPMAETKALCEAEGADGVQVTTHVCDVSDEAQVTRFRDEVAAAHATDRVNLVINNAGIGGGGSMIADDRAVWDRTFAVCWGGVYHMTRAFLPMLVASDEGHLVNTSSVNGFWASLGPDRPHTAYSAAKFAVKGFTEALVSDLRLNAPHVTASVVMPGHIGTGIAANSWAVHGGPSDDPAVVEMGNQFRNSAPTTADEAAAIILAGIEDKKWRILVGDDAHALDEAVRADPEAAYEPNFIARLDGHLQGVLANDGNGR